MWTKTTTSNISHPSGVLSFKYVRCISHLRCTNPNCRCISENGTVNELYWLRSSLDVISLGPTPSL